MTRNKKTIAGLIAGTLLVAGSVVYFNQSSETIKYYPIKNFLRTNTHNWDMITGIGEYGPDADRRAAEKLKAIVDAGISGLRIYIDADKTKDEQNLTFKFSPDGRGFKTDTAIQQLKKMNGMHILYCYQNVPDNIQAPYIQNNVKNTVYAPYGADRSKPETYSLLAHDMAVIAARGGKNANVSDYPLFKSPNWWEPAQIMYKGAGLYDELEPGNEWDNNYSNTQFATGATFAAAWKAVYDSVKKVDPNMIVSTTGVANEDPKILLDAIAWAKQYNGGKIPFDKYQFHCYPWGWSIGIASALPPEMNIVPAAKKMVAAAGGIPCVIGEWGFDKHERSNLGVTPFSNYTSEQVRAFYTTRSILGFAATGLESAYWYKLYQDFGSLNDVNETIFATMSWFVEDNGIIKRNLAGDAVAELAKYKDFTFESQLVENDSVRVYRFYDGSKYLYVGWTVEKVTSVEKWNSNRAQMTERFYDYTFPTGSKVKLSAKPVFILDGAAPIPPDPTPPEPTPPTETYTGRKGYWILESKRVYYKVFKYSDGRYQIKTGDYNWYKS